MSTKTKSTITWTLIVVTIALSFLGGFEVGRDSSRKNQTLANKSASDVAIPWNWTLLQQRERYTLWKIGVKGRALLWNAEPDETLYMQSYGDRMINIDWDTHSQTKTNGTH